MIPGELLNFPCLGFFTYKMRIKQHLAQKAAKEVNTCKELRTVSGTQEYYVGCCCCVTVFILFITASHSQANKLNINKGTKEKAKEICPGK